MARKQQADKPHPAAARPDDKSATPRQASGVVDKKPVVAEIWRSMPTATAKEIADEYHRRTGDTVSIPTVNNAKPADLKRPRTAKKAAESRDGTGPTVEDLKKVKELAAEVGGLEKLSQMVRQVDDVAAKVGGLDRLQASIDALNDLLAE